MARTRTETRSTPRNDVYTGLLVISLIAMITACILLWLDYDQYPAQVPNAPPPPSQAAPAPQVPGG